MPLSGRIISKSRQQPVLTCKRGQDLLPSQCHLFGGHPVHRPFYKHLAERYKVTNQFLYKYIQFQFQQHSSLREPVFFVSWFSSFSAPKILTPFIWIRPVCCDKYCWSFCVPGYTPYSMNRLIFLIMLKNKHTWPFFEIWIIFKQNSIFHTRHQNANCKAIR